jgi:RNA polymerase sigma factor (TIGR02999 family)
MIYAELHRIAASQRRREPGSLTLQTTDLVHEAWLRLNRQREPNWQGRAQFAALAATMVRRVLLDHARKRRTLQRDHNSKVPLEAAHGLMDEGRADELVALDAALDALSQLDARQSRIVELRYFGGLTIAETADALDISPATVKREWEHARAWLYGELHAVNEPHA